MEAGSVDTARRGKAANEQVAWHDCNGRATTDMHAPTRGLMTPVAVLVRLAFTNETVPLPVMVSAGQENNVTPVKPE